MGYNWKDIGIKEITNYYLYGSFERPNNLVDETLIRPSDATTSITIDAASLMSDGPGRYAFGAKSPLVSAFMSGEPVDGWQDGTRATYTKAQIAELFGITSYEINIKQIFQDNLSSDYWQRVYVYNSGSFKISDDAIFVIEADGTRHIENFAIEPNEKIGDKQENFDFSTSGLLQYADSALGDWIDPDKIGKKVLFDYDNFGSIERIDYTQNNFISDNAEIMRLELASLNPIGYDVLLGAMIGISQGLWDSGDTRFVDSEGRAIIYGTNENDVLSYDIVDNLNILSPMYLNTDEEDGVVLIGGNGSDFELGTDADDMLIGGNDTDNDYLNGGTGFDTYIAGDNDIIMDEDGEGEVYFDETLLTGGKKEAGSGCEPTEEDGSSVYKGNGGTYTLSGDTLTFERGGETLTILNFSSGKLGITLEDSSGGGNDCPPPETPCPSPVNPLFHFHFPIPYTSGGGGGSGGGSGGGGGGGGGSVYYPSTPHYTPTPPTPVVKCVNHPDYSSAGAGGGGGSTGPIVLDLNHDGITSISIAASIALFDYDGDGIKENTAWIQSTEKVNGEAREAPLGDALLVNDVWFDRDVKDTKSTIDYTQISDEIKSLGNISGSGDVEDLAIAMSKDSVLVTKVEALVNAIENGEGLIKVNFNNEREVA